MAVQEIARRRISRIIPFVLQTAEGIIAIPRHLLLKVHLPLQPVMAVIALVFRAAPRNRPRNLPMQAVICKRSLTGIGGYNVGSRVES